MSQFFCNFAFCINKRQPFQLYYMDQNNTIAHVNDMKESLIAEIKQREQENILEPENASLLIKLIRNADDNDEAQAIAALGTTYKRTGFHFDKRLEKHVMTDTIKYFVKNEALSFGEAKEGEPIHKLIIGDNYDALNNLLIQYKNKIDVIYIDPPYGKDSLGEYAKTNYKNSITRDNLLSMLYFRLQIAKHLLSDDGVIFCSIDDRNQAYIKCLFDEIFGERNFICNFMWKKTDTPPSLSNKVRRKLEYVLCYTKRYNSKRLFAQGYIDGGDAPLLNSSNPIGKLEFPVGSVHFNIPDGTYSFKKTHSIKLLKDVIVKDGVNVNPLYAEAHFKWGQKNLLQEIGKGTYFLIKSNQFSIRYQKSGKSTKKPSNIIDSEVKVGTNETANSELEKLGFKGDFDYAKPVSLIEFLSKMGFWEQDNITVLDFYAGSGTTGHAILNMNKDGMGKRTFILCQLNEKTDSTPNGIAYDVTSKRLKRIMTGECYDGSKDFEWAKENEPYGGCLEVYEINEISNHSAVEGKTPFDVIDEKLYGFKEKLSPKNKIAWVCSNFSHTQMVEPKDE